MEFWGIDHIAQEHGGDLIWTRHGAQRNSCFRIEFKIRVGVLLSHSVCHLICLPRSTPCMEPC
jgi:hypothetical protein